jgi:RNA polymerase sigma-70 factor (sigma-E family)
MDGQAAAVTSSHTGVADVSREVAFEAYVAARQRTLLRTAVMLTGDVHAAEDLLQTALARLYLSWDRVHQDARMDAYVRRIMVNQHTAWWRRAWRRKELPVAELREDAASSTSSGSSTAEGTVDGVAERDALWQHVHRLPPRQRAAVVLRFYEDLTEAQTAEVLGCAVGTVKSQTSRALHTLRAALAAERGTP